MVLELHIWGPAFTLPSIDPECLAAIAYLTQVLPREAWVLVASSDTTLSPTKELPVLRDDSIAIGGFENIVHHLRERSNGHWDLDRRFTSQKDRADINAFSTFLTSQTHPLLSLSLYVSSENYSKTRTAYSSILPWPTQFFIPPQIRTLAKSRTQHLGLSSLDLSTLGDSERDISRKTADLIPHSLRGTLRPTVTGLVKKKQTSARFKLDALVDAALKPLQKILGRKKWFLSDERPCSLDCLALGYLALAMIPDLPQSWLAEGMRERYPDLCRYVENGIREVFGGEVRLEDALPNSREDKTPTPQAQTKTELPWRAPNHNVSASLLNSTIDLLPFYKRTTVAAVPSTRPPHSSNAPPHTLTSTLLPPLLASAGALAAIAGYLVYANLNTPEPEKRKLSDMGEAGALFASLGFGEPEKEVGIPPTGGRVPVGVEVDLESAGEMSGL